MQAQAERATRDYCRGCGGETLHRFAGYATPDGRENTIRPRAFQRACAICGLIALVLADVRDAEGLARAVLDEHLRQHGGASTATGPPVGPPPLDWEACLNYLFEQLWLLYSEKWNPAFGDQSGTFTGYATATLRKRRSSWIRDETGDASDRTKGRVHPKAHAPSVSTSLDELLDAGEAVAERPRDIGPLARAVAGRSVDIAEDRSPDLTWALAARSS